MSSTTFAILGYSVGMGLPWGYALSLWIGRRRLNRRGNAKGATR